MQNIPCQTNAVDCGVFVTQVTELMSWLYLVNTLFFSKVCSIPNGNEPWIFTKQAQFCVYVYQLKDLLM